MKYLTKIPIILIILGVWLLTLQACGPKASPFSEPSYKEQESCGFVQNVYGERISWKGQLPIRLQIHESVPAYFYQAIEKAIQTWEKAAGKPLFQIASYGVVGPLLPRQEGVSQIYWMKTWEENKASEQARTSIYWVGDLIREADIRINAKHFTFYETGVPSGGAVHLESLILHELGHVLGLKHRDGAGSVMATYLASSTTRNTISSADQASVNCEY